MKAGCIIGTSNSKTLSEPGPSKMTLQQNISGDSFTTCVIILHGDSGTSRHPQVPKMFLRTLTIKAKAIEVNFS